MLNGMRLRLTEVGMTVSQYMLLNEEFVGREIPGHLVQGSY